MRNILWVILTVIGSLSLSAQENLKIENSCLTMQLRQGKISLKGKKSPFQVQQIRVPGNILRSTKSTVSDSLWGKAQQIEICYDNGRTISFRLYQSEPFVHIHTVVANSAEKELRMKQLDFATVEIPVPSGHSSLNSLGTGGLQTIEKAAGSFSYTLLANPSNDNSVLVAWLTQLRGVGFMMPEWNAETRVYSIDTGLEFGNYLVRQGEKRDTDILLIGFFEDGREGLEMYGDCLAKAYDIHLPEKPEVYSTWYHRSLTGSGASNEEKIMENAQFAGQTLADYGLNTFQIDDHWQSSMIKGLTYHTKKQANNIKLNNGPITNFMESNFNYPSGMQQVATRLQEQGFVAGIWFMPFSADANSPYCNPHIFARNAKDGLPYTARRWSGSCIDATGTLGEAFLRDRFRRIYQWGYRYWKIDGLHTGAPSENVYVQRDYKGSPMYGDALLSDSHQTFVQGFRRGLTLLKEEAPDVFLLGCSATQNMSSLAGSFGLVHAMRVGPDNDGATVGKWNIVTRGADYAGNLYFLHNRVWYNDPDPYYVRESNPLPKARWMVTWQAVTGVMSTTSVQYSELSEERLNLIRRALPTHSLNARPVDILENRHPRIWTVRNERMHLVGLFNWSETDTTQINCPLQRLGLGEQVSYNVFDFWSDTYKGTITGRLVEGLEPVGCRALSLRRVENHPQVISTSRHITQGLVDIVTEVWDKTGNTLSGTSKVVAKDVYELRVVLPEGVKVQSASFGDTIADVKMEGRLARVSFLPEKTGEIDWRVRFDKGDKKSR